MSDQCCVVAVVQARMGSTRLPGKMLACLAGQPVLEHVLQRTRRAELVDMVVLASPDNEQDDVLELLATDLDLPVVRGSEADVLGRIHQAGKEHNADVVVRVCADNPLIAPEEIDRAVRHHDNNAGGYTFNHIPAKDNDYPDGFGAEVIDMSVLDSIERAATDSEHREHVTAYIWDNEEAFTIHAIPAPKPLAEVDIAVDLDTASDYKMLRRLFAHAPTDVAEWSAQAIVKTYQNQIIPGQARPETSKE